MPIVLNVADAGGRFAAYLRDSAKLPLEKFRLVVPPPPPPDAKLPHRHLCWEVNILSRDIRDIPFAPPHILRLVPPGLEHDVGAARELQQGMTVSVYPHQLACNSNHCGFNFQLNAGDLQSINRLILLMRTAVEYTESSCDQKLIGALRNAVLLAMAELIESLEFSDAQSENNPDNLAWCFIDRNFADPDLSLGDIARYAARSPQNLNRWFRREYGESVWHHLLNRRLEQAERLLRETTLDIAEIARQCGWRNRNYFSRSFRARYHLPPGEYRKMLTHTDPAPNR